MSEILGSPSGCNRENAAEGRIPGKSSPRAAQPHRPPPRPRDSFDPRPAAAVFAGLGWPLDAPDPPPVEPPARVQVEQADLIARLVRREVKRAVIRLECRRRRGVRG
jgi:hypothetical protein